MFEFCSSITLSLEFERLRMHLLRVFDKILSDPQNYVRVQAFLLHVSVFLESLI